MDKSAKIFIAGHLGMAGSSIQRRLLAAGYNNLIYKSHAELDLTNQSDVTHYLNIERPDYIFLAAGKVGGIKANNRYRADFIYQNIMIETNIIHAAWQAGVKRMLFLGSSCIYPRDCSQPISEDYLLTGPLEQTNEPYALAKILGVKLCESYNRQYGTQYISAMPTNLYGPNDSYNLESCHVLPALIRKAHEAKVNGDKEFVIWGTGEPRREFLFVDDMADACIFLMEKNPSDFLYNIGIGKDMRIQELAEMVVDIVGFQGIIVNDTSQPDGTPRKLLNVEKLHSLGWAARTSLREGITLAYRDFLNNGGRN
ncbi:GDP-L-fucose synthase family protein [Pseudomonas sp. S2_H01]